LRILSLRGVDGGERYPVKTVAILGSKGGTGKSSLAHCLAYGAHLADREATMVHTDHRPPVKSRRPYEYLDASANYARAIQLIRERNGRSGLLVIDGAGNRPHVDLWVARSVDLALIPVTNSAEDVRCALDDLARFANPHAYVIINRWPANRLVRLVMQRYVERLPQSRVAGHLPEIGAMRLFLDDGEWHTPPTKVGNAARRLFRTVSGVLESLEAQPSDRITPRLADNPV
jgi:chromosome partitioning protein